MNINMLRDTDDDGGFYVAVTTPDPKWPGCALFRSTDDGASYQQIATITTASTVGRVLNALGDFAGGNTVDEANTLRVMMTRGTLSSVTYAAFLNGAQAAIIGDEIVYFRNAALNPDGTYTVSGFLRGQRGSDYAMASHATGERFILVDTSLQRIPGVTADLHTPRLYKAVTAGSSLARTAAKSFTNDGAELKPYAPVLVGGGRDAAGNLTITWTRRARISGEWRNGAEVPLGEASEAYDVEITDASYSTVKRTFSGLSSPSVAYSAADQAADGIAQGDPIYVRVYQLSATIGRGYPGMATLQIAGVTGAPVVVTPPAPSGSTATITYTASSANFANPERGFARQVSNCQNVQFYASNVSSLRTGSAISMYWMLVYLNSYVSSSIPSGVLSNIQANFDALRAGGAKAWLRFSYDQSGSGADATKAQVKAHIDQLAPLLQANADVIAVMDVAFIGSWGEWSQSNNFGWYGSFTTQNWADRKEVLEYLLDALPSNRSVMLRVPGFKQHFYGTTALNGSTAFTGSYASRIGHHDDAFMSGSDDQGTYGLSQSVSADRAYTAQETKYTPRGGESDHYNSSDNSYTSCPSSIGDLSAHHWSLLNDAYEPNVLNQWTSEGCMSDIKKNLGYRFVLESGTYPTSGTRGAAISVSILLNNVGYAAPFNPRTAKLVLRNTSGGAETVIALVSDPRTWLPGEHTIAESLTLPSSMAAGTYKLLLALPDMASSLAANPAYAIQLANTGVWEASTGYNDLGHTITIS